MQTERTATQVAWAAGLFEGEGCWNAYVRKSGKIQMQARVAMTDRDVVERFARIVGFGSVSRLHRPSAQARGDKPLFEWRVYEATKVREVIDLLMPYLGERRRARAEEVLRLGADVRPANEQKTHCPQGHPLEGENLIREPTRRSGKEYVARRCRECRRKQGRERMRRAAGHDTREAG